MRIVSLLPAATEIVWALGLEADLVGISHACDYPAAVTDRPAVTRVPAAIAGAAQHHVHELVAAGAAPLEVDVEALAGLRPDLVLAGPAIRGDRGLEAAIRAAAGPDADLVVLEPISIEGIFHAVATVGAMTDAEDEAVGLVELLRERLADVEEVAEERRAEGHPAPRVVTLEWLDPPMTAGLWVPEQVRRAGGWEVLGSDGQPGAAIGWDAVAEMDPEMLLLAPCGMHLAEAVRAWRSAPRPAGWGDLAAVRRGRVVALDAAAYVSRPGPRVVDGIELLAEIFDPDAFVDLAPAGSWVPVQ